MNPANPVEQAALDSDVEKCVQCGKCTAGCPSGRQSRLRTRTLVQMAYQGRDVTDMEELWDCTTCYNCAERCPKGVNTVDAVIALRNLAVRKGNFPRVHLGAIENLYNNLASLARLCACFISLSWKLRSGSPSSCLRRR